MGVLLKMGLDENEITAITKKLIVSKKWLYENYEKLRETYANKYVAVDDQCILDSDKDMKLLIKRLKKNSKNINEIMIELINSKNIKLLL